MRRVAAILFLSLAAACRSDTAEEQRLRGAAAYEAYCLACHEQAGGIGPKLSPAVLAARVSAAELFAYNRNQMPYNAGGTLTEQQYWDITAYLLWRSGLFTGERPLNANSAEVPLTLLSR